MGVCSGGGLFWGVVSDPRGWCLIRGDGGGGVCSTGGWYVLQGGGVCSGGRVLVSVPGGWCLLQGGGIPACTEADPSPCEQNE